MIKNYFITAWRNIWKNKATSFINVVGLSVGLTVCLLMVLYIQSELNYDKFQKNGDRIARVIMEYGMGGEFAGKMAGTSAKVLPVFKQNFPEIEEGVRMFTSKALIKAGETIYEESRYVFADATFFKVFPSFHLLQGDPATVFKDIKSVVLSESIAKKYFGKEDAVGKIIKIGAAQQEYAVTGIIEDCPAASQIKYDLLTSFKNLFTSFKNSGVDPEGSYSNANFFTYLLLKDKKSFAALQSKITSFAKKESRDLQPKDIKFELEPFEKVHLYSPYEAFEPNSNISYIYITGGIAILMLLIACFTYINLSTARSLERAKEVGIRKVSGAGRAQVFWQFIGESLIVSLIALVVSIMLTLLVLPAFNKLTGKSLFVTSLITPQNFMALVIMMVTIALLAGGYPALILSRFLPVKVLKGSFKNTQSGNLLRKSLIVFQFVISAFLITATIIMHYQMRYIQQKKLGYDKDHVIVTKIDGKIADKLELLKATLTSHTHIKSVSASEHAPVHIIGGYSMRSSTMTAAQDLPITANPIDEDYIPTNGLELIAGENLSKQDVLDVGHQSNDSNYVRLVLNESAVKKFGWTTKEAVGKKVFFNGDLNGEVKGVVKDFNYESLHNPIGALALFPAAWGPEMTIKISGDDYPQTISYIKKVWKELAPHRPFSYAFLNETYQQLYTAEQRTRQIFNIFSVIAILLACLGLFGLSAYTVILRNKEIGIRKILGSSISAIVRLLSKDFMKLVTIAILIAIPLAWWAMDKWLQDFAYRTHLQWWMFIIAAALAIIIALITISFQIIKAAIANPVESLRTE